MPGRPVTKEHVIHMEYSKKTESSVNDIVSVVKVQLVQPHYHVCSVSISTVMNAILSLLNNLSTIHKCFIAELSIEIESHYLPIFVKKTVNKTVR